MYKFFNSNSLSKIAGAVLFGALKIATHGSSGIIIELLNEVAGSKISGFLEKFDLKTLKGLFKSPDPTGLNKEIQELLPEAVEWSILNIAVLYKKHKLTEAQVKELDDFIKKIIKEIKGLSSTAYDKINVRQIENPDHNLLDDLFDDIEFPVINPDYPFDKFFKERFEDNLQLCFGELLKKEENKEAYVSYQREIYKQLSDTVEQILKQNQEILKSLNDRNEKEKREQELQQWKNIKNEIPVFASVSGGGSEFDRVFNARLEELQQKNELLVDLTKDIQIEVKRISGMIAGFETILEQNWLQKNKVLALSVLAVLSAVIVFLFYYLNHLPFNTQVHLQPKPGLKVNEQYPKLSDKARLRIYLPFENKDKQVTFNNEISLNDIPATYKNTKVKIELLDQYWKLATDSLLLVPGNRSIDVIPNGSLAKITGRILKRNLQETIPGAKVFVGGVETTSDKNGNFELEIPVASQQPEYTLRVEKNGYISVEKYVVPGGKIDIALEEN